MILFVVEVHRIGGHGEEAFPVLVSADFGKCLETAATIESSGGYHGFHHAEDHGVFISRLVQDRTYKHRSMAVGRDCSDDTLVYARRPDIAKMAGSRLIIWKEDWFDEDLAHIYKRG